MICGTNQKRFWSSLNQRANLYFLPSLPRTLWNFVSKYWIDFVKSMKLVFATEGFHCGGWFKGFECCSRPRCYGIHLSMLPKSPSSCFKRAFINICSKAGVAPREISEGTPWNQSERVWISALQLNFLGETVKNAGSTNFPPYSSHFSIRRNPK